MKIMMSPMARMIQMLHMRAKKNHDNLPTDPFPNWFIANMK